MTAVWGPSACCSFHVCCEEYGRSSCLKAPVSRPLPSEFGVKGIVRELCQCAAAQPWRIDAMGKTTRIYSLHPHLLSKERESLSAWRPARTNCSRQEWLTPHGTVSWGSGLWHNGIFWWRRPGLHSLAHHGSNHPLPKVLANWVMTRLKTREEDGFVAALNSPSRGVTTRV